MAVFKLISVFTHSTKWQYLGYILLFSIGVLLDTESVCDILQVNVVAFPSRTSGTVEVPPGCGNGLFVASQANLNNIKVFTGQLTPVKGNVSYF